MIRLTFFSLLLLILGSCHSNVKDMENMDIQEVPTPLQQKDFTELTTSAELKQYLEHLDTLHEFMVLEEIGTSVQGKPILLTKVAKNGVTAGNRLNVLLFAQQHGNEPSGKEGLLMLLRHLAENNNHQLLDKLNLFIIPQLNPDGGDMDQRRNANDVDLNRDHLLISSPEVQAVQQLFKQYAHEVTVDIHEYYPFGESWEEFGYRRDFDIQLGGLTNLNVDSRIRTFFDNMALPYVQQRVQDSSYSFFEYTLGHFPSGERLRHSTVDVNDGRQSFGILNTLSFIVEGMNGRSAIDNIERRAKSQFITALSLVQLAYDSEPKIRQMVTRSREQLTTSSPGTDVAIRMEHVQGEEPLQYSLLSLSTGEDTVFTVEKYHSRVMATLSVKKPEGYLIPTGDKKLVDWLKRSQIEYYDYHPFEKHRIMQYKILSHRKSVDEELENFYPEVEKVEVKRPINENEYYYVSTKQLYSNKLVTALEPQAMYGLINYPEFNYLLDKEFFPILRHE